MRRRLAIFANPAIMGLMPTQNVNLSQQQARFIRSTIDKGRYRNASEVVRAGLRLLEQQEREDRLKLDLLRRLADESFQEIDGGDYQMLTADGLDEFLAKVDTKARASRLR